jgi:putative radical SAM enzyme (TIGR03279 family)
MSVPRVIAVAPGSPAARAGIETGDEITSVNGEVPRDLIEWRMLVDAAEVALDVQRGGLELLVEVDKGLGEPLGVEVHSALFDRVRTCDNHCEFCFIYQLPPGLRRSLYLKDDDYRLSFLYGNFTTLTRFTEADLERIVSEGLSPLYVSIHATDPSVRADMLRNKRGATSLRWLRALLDHGVEVHGQVVVCPGVNDGSVLDDTLAGVLDRYPELATLCVVPLGVSAFNKEARMRPHTLAEAVGVVDAVDDWQQVFAAALGRPLVYAADEYYLLARRPFPPAESYAGFPMHEDGIGMARAFEQGLFGSLDAPIVAASSTRSGSMSSSGLGGAECGAMAPTAGRGTAPPSGTGLASGECGTGPPASVAVEVAPADAVAGPAVALGAGSGAPHERGGFFRWADGDLSGSSDTDYEPYRAERAETGAESLLHIGPSRKAPVAVLTAPYGARVLAPLLERLDRPDVRIVEVENRYFGGNIAVSGLMVGEDIARVLADQPEGHRYLLPDVCLSQGRFLDGTEPSALPRPVEIVPADGAALRAALGFDPEPVAVADEPLVSAEVVAAEPAGGSVDGPAPVSSAVPVALATAAGAGRSEP